MSALRCSFEGKHFLITGGTSGIGQQSVWDLSSMGAKVTLIGRDQNKASDTIGSCPFPEKLSVILGDLSHEGFLEDLSKSIDPLDGIVLSAGIIDYTPIKLINREKINRIFDINVSANIMLIQQLLKRKKIKSGASIVIISSISSKLGVQGTGLYAASKAAISAFAKVMASELATKRIRVNVISPGIVKTKLVIDKGVISEDSFDDKESKYPFGYGKTEDISNQIIYFLSDSSTWITGTEVILDGGFTINC